MITAKHAASHDKGHQTNNHTKEANRISSPESNCYSITAIYNQNGEWHLRPRIFINQRDRRRQMLKTKPPRQRREAICSSWDWAWRAWCEVHLAEEQNIDPTGDGAREGEEMRTLRAAPGGGREGGRGWERNPNFDAPLPPQARGTSSLAPVPYAGGWRKEKSVDGLLVAWCGPHGVGPKWGPLIRILCIREAKRVALA